MNTSYSLIYKKNTNMLEATQIVMFFLYQHLLVPI